MKKLVIKKVDLPENVKNVLEEFIKGLENNNTEVTESKDYYLIKLAERWNWEYNKVCSYLEKLYSLYPAAAINIYLKEVAIQLDKNYPDNIRNSAKIYCISMTDGTIFELDKSHIKSFKNFAAFRNIEDAEYALDLIKPALEDIFK